MKKLLTFVSLFFLAKLGLACSCWPYEANFYKNISNTQVQCIAVFDTMDRSFVQDHLAAQTGFFILIDTIGSYDGAIGDTLTVVGQDGVNCGESLGGFTKGDTVVLTLMKTHYPPLPKNTYYLEGLCGKHYLSIKNGEHAQLGLPEIKTKIRKILAYEGAKCVCRDFWDSYYFFDNIPKAQSTVLAIFQGFDYSYRHDGFSAQTGDFILLDAVGAFPIDVGDTLHVLGEDGINCGEMLDRFHPGDTLFLALSKGDEEELAEGFFYLKGGSCGLYYLPIVDGFHDGSTVSEIKEEIKSTVIGISKTNTRFDLVLFPNPTSGIIHLESPNHKIIRIEVLDSSGKFITARDNISDHEVDISLAELPTGSYNLHIETEAGRVFRHLGKF